MINDFAYWYIALENHETRVVHGAIFIASAIAAGFLYRGYFHIQRIPYFVYSGAVFAVQGVLATIWIGAWSAIIHGYAALVVAIEILVLMGLGAIVMVIATARARDAYGNSAAAILAFIPVLNLILMLAPSKNKDIAGAYTPLRRVTGQTGIFLGMGLFLIGWLATATTLRAMNAQKLSSEASAWQNQANIIVELKSKGLAGALASVAESFERSVMFEDTSVLVDVTSEGSTLRYHYRDRVELNPIAPEILAEAARNICQDVGMLELIKAGATIERVFSDPTGKQHSIAITTAATCAAQVQTP